MATPSRRSHVLEAVLAILVAPNRGAYCLGVACLVLSATMAHFLDALVKTRAAADLAVSEIALVLGHG